MFPEPALLSKKAWRDGVLPEMAFRMGLDLSSLRGTSAAELNEMLTALPSAPLVTEEEWNAIREYYLASAPEEIPPTDLPRAAALEQFTPLPISLPVRGKNFISMVRWDASQNKLWVGTRAGGLYALDADFALTDSVALVSPAADMLFPADDAPAVAMMGIMDPNDLPAGSVALLQAEEPRLRLLADSIKRPVDLGRADLNRDGLPDLIVSAFGNFTGGLLAYEDTGTGYRKHVIHNFPGTRRTVIRDVNADGLPDVLALVTQGDEQIALFTNRGDFRFSYRILLRFPPVYGSSYFALHDFNGDGHPDILYTNGDNADYSRELKPYHGVRVFLNDGAQHFTQSWFYPMHGASAARAADFDRDGDTDIAAISFFPDFIHRPENGFLFFENDGGEFVPHATEAASLARWITIETCDPDGDGDTDIALGALAFPATVPDSLYLAWGKTKTSLLFLENNAAR